MLPKRRNHSSRIVGSETTMDVEFVRALKKVVVAYFMALRQNVPRGTEK